MSDNLQRKLAAELQTLLNRLQSVSDDVHTVSLETRRLQARIWAICNIMDALEKAAKRLPEP